LPGGLFEANIAEITVVLKNRWFAFRRQIRRVQSERENIGRRIYPAIHLYSVAHFPSLKAMVGDFPTAWRRSLPRVWQKPRLLGVNFILRCRLIHSSICSCSHFCSSVRASSRLYFQLSKRGK